ncbi:MAG: ribonuclease P protein component [Myxococcota bacterium]
MDTEYFRVFLVDRSDGSGARLGITVTRKVGNAVRRNRIKRLVREWFRHRDHELGSCDLIVIVKRDVPPAPTLRGICQDLDGVLGTRRVGS